MARERKLLYMSRVADLEASEKPPYFGSRTHLLSSCLASPRFAFAPSGHLRDSQLLARLAGGVTNRSNAELNGAQPELTVVVIHDDIQ